MNYLNITYGYLKCFNYKFLTKHICSKKKKKKWFSNDLIMMVKIITTHIRIYYDKRFLHAMTSLFTQTTFTEIKRLSI
jgi:hypothetical protein